MISCTRWAAALGSLLAAPVALAGSVAVFTVDSGQSLAPQIDMAIDSANQGIATSLEFPPGTYTFDTTPVGGTFTMIELRGELDLVALPGDAVMIDAQGQGQLMRVGSGRLGLHGLSFNFFVSDSFGGVVSVEGGGGLDVSNSLFFGNQAAQDGGAIAAFNNSGDINIWNSAFVTNIAGNNGGALDFEYTISTGSARTWVGNSFFAGNRASVFGCTADIFDARSPLDTGRTVFSDNALVDACVNVHFENPLGGFTLRSNLIVFDDDAVDSTGQVDLFGNVLVAQDFLGVIPKDGEPAAAKSACNDFGSGAFNSLGFNLSTDGSCGLTQPTDQPGTDPMLAQDMDTGKFEILAGSPLIDAAPAELVALTQGGSKTLPCGYKDVNGLGRPQDGDGDGDFGCDLGNVEFQGGADIAAPQSSAYFDPDRNGEGFFVEMLEGGEQAFVAMFTYDASAPNGLAWFVGVGSVVGNSVVIDDFLRPTGGVFGESFDADAIVRTPIAGTSLNFPSCQASSQPGRAAFQAMVGSPYQDLLTGLSRLSTVVGCGGPAPASSGRSGSFFDPARSGEGIFVQWLNNGSVLVIWYTFDPDGNQFWTISGDQVMVNGDTVTLNMLYPSGTTGFGEDFNAAEVELSDWGTVTLEYNGCDSLEFSYDSVVAGFGSGSLDYQRLTRLAGTLCDL